MDMATSRRPVISHVNWTRNGSASGKLTCTDPFRRGVDVPGRPKWGPQGRWSTSDDKLTRLLLNVNIERSLGPVQVILRPDDTVRDLIKTAVEIYVKEKRRPPLKDTDPGSFELHYSPFSFENLSPGEKLGNLGSRKFFMCSRPMNSLGIKSSFSEEANKAIFRIPPSLTKLMEFLL